MTVIISDSIVSPPTWPLSIRDLSLQCNISLELPVVIESADPDPFYRWLKPKGCMDFIEDIVKPETERGLCLAPRHFIYRPTIVVDRIVPENISEILGRIRSRKEEMEKR